jgi:hypothetical protein
MPSIATIQMRYPTFCALICNLGTTIFCSPPTYASIPWIPFQFRKLPPLRATFDQNHLLQPMLHHPRIPCQTNCLMPSIATIQMRYPTFCALICNLGTTMFCSPPTYASIPWIPFQFRKLPPLRATSDQNQLLQPMLHHPRIPCQTNCLMPSIATIQMRYPTFCALICNLGTTIFCSPPTYASIPWIPFQFRKLPPLRATSDQNQLLQPMLHHLLLAHPLQYLQRRQRNLPQSQ